MLHFIKQTINNWQTNGNGNVFIKTIKIPHIRKAIITIRIESLTDLFPFIRQSHSAIYLREAVTANSHWIYFNFQYRNAIYIDVARA